MNVMRNGVRANALSARAARVWRGFNRLWLKVRSYRESFRPFAPSVLCDRLREWFELDVDSPYMLLVAPIAGQHKRAMTERRTRCSASTSSTSYWVAAQSVG